MTEPTNAEQQALWQRVETAWNADRRPKVSAADLLELIDEYWDLIRWCKSAAVAEQTISAVLRQLELRALLREHRLLLLWAEVLPVSELTQKLLVNLGSLEIDSRVEVLRKAIGSIAERAGREEARLVAEQLWNQPIRTEEEREALLQSLDSSGALNPAFLNRLGEEARRIARAVGTTSTAIESGAALEIGGTLVARDLGLRIGALLKPVDLGLDVTDARLADDELARLLVANAKNPSLEYAIDRVLQETVSRSPYGQDPGIRGAVTSLLSLTLSRTGPDGERHAQLSCSLLRLLHLRLILETPSLDAGLYAPEEHLVPEVMLYLLGKEGVAYHPLRVDADMSPGPRARWAEYTAEAMAVVFLQDAVSLDLQTLSRIPQLTTVTPDFQARTVRGEPIVFESKGSTDWKTHRAQHRHALEQLQKRVNARGRRVGLGWRGPGRTFACCLFAARQSTKRPSRLLIDDPPFPFADAFGSGWEDRARRHHYAAVLEAAQAYDLARRLVNPELRISRESTLKRYELRSRGANAEPQAFMVNRLELSQLARQLAHPNPEQYDRISVHVGVRAEIYAQLANGVLPSIEPSATPNAEEVGVIRGPQRGLPDVGVYSILSDGAFLSVEAEPVSTTPESP